MHVAVVPTWKLLSEVDTLRPMLADAVTVDGLVELSGSRAGVADGRVAGVEALYDRVVRGKGGAAVLKVAVLVIVATTPSSSLSKSESIVRSTTWGTLLWSLCMSVAASRQDGKEQLGCV